MRKLYILIITISLSFQITNAKVDTRTDTLFIGLDKELTMTFPLTDLTEIKNTGNLDSIFRDLVTDIKLLDLKTGNENTFYSILLIKSGNSNGISIKTKENLSDQYRIQNDTVYHKLKMHTLNYRNDELQFSIDFHEFSDLYELAEININSKIDSISKRIDKEGGYCRYSRQYKYEFKNNSDSPNATEIYYSNMLDILELNISTGANLIRHQLVPDFGFKVGLVFSKKEVFRNEYNLKTNIMTFFEETEKGYHTYYNTLVSLGYRHNYTNSKAFSNWIGVDLGYMVKTSGPYFGKNTFMLGANWELKEFGMFNVSIAPQVYFSENFKDVFPAVRLGIGF